MHCVYFSRHGETVWNVENKICGMTDSPLTEKGRAQAAQLGEAVKNSGIVLDEILYSPLSRAADTALAVAAATGLPARVEPRLREQCFGRFEGTSPPQQPGVHRRQNAVCRPLHRRRKYASAGPAHLQPAGRAQTGRQDLSPRGPQRIARVVESYFHNMTNAEYAAFGIKNCELRKFDFDE